MGQKKSIIDKVSERVNLRIASVSCVFTGPSDPEGRDKLLRMINTICNNYRGLYSRHCSNDFFGTTDLLLQGGKNIHTHVMYCPGMKPYVYVIFPSTAANNLATLSGSSCSMK